MEAEERELKGGGVPIKSNPMVHVNGVAQTPKSTPRGRPELRMHQCPEWAGAGAFCPSVHGWRYMEKEFPGGPWVWVKYRHNRIK